MPLYLPTVPGYDPLPIPEYDPPPVPITLPSRPGPVDFFPPQARDPWGNLIPPPVRPAPVPVPFPDPIYDSPPPSPMPGPYPPPGPYPGYPSPPQLPGPVPGPGVTPPPSSSADPFFDVPGFDPTKLRDLNYSSPKYSPAVRIFAQALGSMGLPPTSESLQRIVDYARSRGFPNARVTGNDTIDFGDGYGPIDVITDVGGPGAGWWFNNQPGSGGGSAPPTSTPSSPHGSLSGLGSGGGTGGPFSYPPFTPPEFNVPPFEAPAPFDYPDWTPGAPFDYPEWTPSEPFSYPSFVAPSIDTFTADPGYQFRLAEGLRALQHAAAAKGILRTGGTLKGLMDYGQNLASEEFQNVVNRQFRDWLAGRTAAAEDYDRNLANRRTDWETGYESAKDIYDRNLANRRTDWLTGYNRAADIYDRNWQNQLTDYMADYNRAADKFNRALTTYGTNFNTASFGAGFNRDTRNQNFNNLLQLYDLSTRNLPRYTPMTPPLGML